MERKDIKKTSLLWNRFAKVRRAIQVGLGNQTSDFTRKLNTFCWSGIDSGIQDHSGSLTGNIQGTELDLSIKGTTVNENPEYDDNWKLVTKTKRDISISGHYISGDGMDGWVSIMFQDGETLYEAYWLNYKKQGYRLEQVVSQDGQVFDADNLQEDKKGEVVIPGTKISFKRIIKK